MSEEKEIVVNSLKPLAVAPLPPPPPKPAKIADATRTEFDKLGELRTKVNTGTGQRSVKRVGSYGQTRRISTGILELDISLGVNLDGSAGIPVGAASIFVGNESSGKTTTSLRVAGNGQRLCSHCYRPAKNLKEVQLTDDSGQLILTEDGEIQWVLTGECDCFAKGIWKPAIPLTATKADQKAFEEWKEQLQINSYRPFQVVFIDAEDSYDPNWAARFMFPRCMEIVYPTSAEDAIDITIAYISSGVVDMVIFDSLALATPSTEIEESAEKQQQGLQARLLNKFTRRSTASALASGVTGRPVTQIWIQQWREKLGVMFGDNRVMPGGKGQRFAASCIVEFNASGFVEVDDPRYVDSGIAKDLIPKVKTHCSVSALVSKNKTAAPKRVARYELRLIDYGEWRAGEIDDESRFQKMLAHEKIKLFWVEQQSASKKVYKVSCGGKEHVFTTQDASKTFINENRRALEREYLVKMAQWDMSTTKS